MLIKFAPCQRPDSVSIEARESSHFEELAVEVTWLTKEVGWNVIFMKRKRMWFCEKAAPFWRVGMTIGIQGKASLIKYELGPTPRGLLTSPQEFWAFVLFCFLTLNFCQWISVPHLHSPSRPILNSVLCPDWPSLESSRPPLDFFGNYCVCNPVGN